jgi:predicted HD phosphohydrolase
MDTLAQALRILDMTAEETYGEEISHLHHAIQTYYHLLKEDINIRVAGFWHDIGHSYSAIFTEDKDKMTARC